MKAKVIETGEIIDLAEEGIIAKDGRHFCWYQVDLIPEPIDEHLVLTDSENDVTIPFGVADSELSGFEYTIPEGYEAEIKDGKVIVRKAESEDERIRKELIEFVKSTNKYGTNPKCESWIAWLEKQRYSEFKLENEYWRGYDDGKKQRDRV